MMKKSTLLFAVATMLIAFTATAQPTPSQTGFIVKKDATTTVLWETTTQDVGEIEQGKPVDVYFELENSGDVPLIITKVQTSCGCTVSDFEREPIMPGGSSKIKATYNAKSKGAFTKTITVYANTASGTKSLIIKGIVK